jgi:hypothetical protein
MQEVTLQRRKKKRTSRDRRRTRDISARDYTCLI